MASPPPAASATPPAPAATTTADSSRSPRSWAWTTPRSRIPSSGFSLVTLNPETRAALPPHHRAAAARAQGAHRRPPPTDTRRSFRGPAARHGSSGGGVRVKAVCDCGRNVRVVPSVLAQAPIMCGACGKPFRIPEVERAGRGLMPHRRADVPPDARGAACPADVRRSAACGRMDGCTRQPHRTPLSSG